MPRRNLNVIILAAIIALVCYRRADRNPYAAVFSEVLHLVGDNYVDPVDQQELFHGAMDGMMERLDPHSAYIGPEEFREFRAGLDQEFGGVGIEVTIDPDTNRLTVMSPLIGTPAYKAGMQAGDTIMEIDGKDTEGMTLRDSVGVMRGKPGTTVKLTVLHRGEKDPVTFAIKRAKIKTESVLGDTRDASGGWEFCLEENPRIGYIRVTTFGEQTARELAEALKSDDHAVDALILDLRNNAGGLLTAAVAVCDMFIDEGRIISSRSRDSEKVFYAHARETVVDPNVPLAVLVNKYSASASEIVAACLKDHGRAKIIGTRTWGKGTVQNVIPLEGGTSVLKLTTASYWRPNNKNIHRKKDATEDDQWGVRPDQGFEVVLSKEEFEKVFRCRRERDVVRTDAEGRVQPPTQERPSRKTPGEDGSAPQTDADAETKDEPFDDPQLRKAIEYLEKRLAELSRKKA